MPKETEQCAVENLFLFLFFKLGPGIKKIGEAQLQKGLFFPVFLINNKLYPKI